KPDPATGELPPTDVKAAEERRVQTEIAFAEERSWPLARKSGQGPAFVPLLLEDVFDFFAGLLDVALGLVELALSLELVVVGGLADGLLTLALQLFGLVLDFIVETHHVSLSSVQYPGDGVPPHADSKR